MAVSTLVDSAEVKIQAKVTSTGDDALIDDIIERVCERFEGETGRKFLTATYTTEKYDGNGHDTMQLRQWPVSAVSAAAIEDESAIDTTDDDFFRWRKDGRITLIGRHWSEPNGRKIENVSITYTAGYAAITNFKDSPAASPPGMPDAHAMLIAACVKSYHKIKTEQGKGIASMGHMGGSIAYFDPSMFDDGFDRWRWGPIAGKYRRRTLGA